MAMGIADMPTVALLFVITGVVIAVGLAVESDVQTDIGEDYGVGSIAYNATGDAIEGTAELSDKLPLIGLVVAFGILLKILFDSMLGGFRA